MSHALAMQRLNFETSPSLELEQAVELANLPPMFLEWDGCWGFVVEIVPAQKSVPVQYGVCFDYCGRTLYGCFERKHLRTTYA